MDSQNPESDKRNPVYHIIGASARGPYHQKDAIPCQDAFAYNSEFPGIGIIAVADGLGSASLSDFGARHAVDMAIQTVMSLISDTASSKPNWEMIIKEAIYSSRKVLEEKAVEFQCKLRDLACTLIVVVLYKEGTAVAHIGDGAVVAKTQTGFNILSTPGESEYVNEVSPLTGKEWENALRVSCSNEPIEGIMVFTDGLQRAALKKMPDGWTPSEGFCNPLFSYAEEAENLKAAENDLKDFLLSDKFKYFEDDKTLVIAVLDNIGKTID